MTKRLVLLLTDDAALSPLEQATAKRLTDAGFRVKLSNRQFHSRREPNVELVLAEAPLDTRLTKLYTGVRVQRLTAETAAEPDLFGLVPVVAPVEPALTEGWGSGLDKEDQGSV